MSEPLNDDYRVEELTESEREMQVHGGNSCVSNIYTGDAQESDLSLQKEAEDDSV